MSIELIENNMFIKEKIALIRNKRERREKQISPRNWQRYLQIAAFLRNAICQKNWCIKQKYFSKNMK